MRARARDLDSDFGGYAEWTQMLALLNGIGMSDEVQLVAREILAGTLSEPMFVPTRAEIERTASISRSAAQRLRATLKAMGVDIFARKSPRLQARCALAQEFMGSFGSWWYRVSGLVRGAAADIDRKDVIAAGEQLIARDLRGEPLPDDPELVRVPPFTSEIVRRAVEALKAQDVYARGPA
jgi:hypothetical protein